MFCTLTNGRSFCGRGVGRVNTREQLEANGKRYRQARGYPPDPLFTSENKVKRLASKAIDDGTGWLCRLAQAGPCLKVGRLDLRRLKLEHLQGEENLWNHESIAEIKNAVLGVMVGPFYARVECGVEARNLHLHVATHAPLQGVRCHLEPVRSLGAVAQYFVKPAVPSDDLAIGIYLEAKCKAFYEGRTLPRVAFWRGIPGR
jgi:hypothetical protein